MKYHLLKSSRLFSLLLMLVICACKKDVNKASAIKAETLDKEIIKSNSEVVKDSLYLSIKLNSKQGVVINALNRQLNTYTVRFYNEGLRDSVITKKILKHPNGQMLVSMLMKDNKLNWQMLLIENKVKDFMLEINEGEFVFDDIGVHNVYDLFDKYSKIKNRAIKDKDKSKLKSELKNLFSASESNYKKKKEIALQKINKYYYINTLQAIDPQDKEIHDFLVELKKPLAIGSLRSIIYLYIKSNIDFIKFNELNIQNYSREFISFMEKGMFNFLKFEDNKGDKKYQPAIDWLKTTDFYKNDSINIKKEITPLNNTKFKKRLKSLVLLDDSFTETSFPELLSANPSQYYLIDFWATWCAPCIDGIKRIHDIDIPKNVKVINLSTDKLKDQQKWKLKSKELNVKIDALIKSDEKTNKEFIKFIEMVTIPRYILIDKNMNLIDEAFYRPHEPQFLEKIKDIKNWKHW